MNKITLYDGTELNSDMMMDFKNDVKNLSDAFFSDTARSLKVRGRHWVAYTQENFKGEFVVYGEGDHPNLGKMDRKIRSLRLVSESLMNPQILLFEHVSYEGRSGKVDREVKDLSAGSFNDMVSSHKVKQGVWLLYQNVNLVGSRFITFKGDEWPNYCERGWNDKMSSLRPLTSSDFEV